MSPRRRTHTKLVNAIPSHHARLRRQLGRLLVLLQVLGVILSFQIAGLAHPLADAVFGEDCAAECGDENSNEPDSECPPGCPTCHGCAHAQALYAPRVAAPLAPPTLELIPAPMLHESAPQQPLLESVFRPPRA